jgi:hypothetical protein
MAGYFPYELDELLESPEFEEFEEYDEFDDEARRRRAPRRPAAAAARRAPLRTPPRGNAVPQRPAPGHATKAELTATANRLDGRIATNSTAIKTLEGRVNTVSTQQTALRTDITRLQGSINDVRNMSMLLPLLSSQKTRTITQPPPGTDLQSGDKVVVDSGDSFSKLLPLMMFSGGFGGSGGSSGSSGGMFGGDSGGLMMVAMMMAMQNK